jgi:hypothetical protein
MGEDPRAVLERLIAESAEDFAGLSKLIGRNPTYIQQFIKRGSPKKLPETERGILARYFGVDESVLGGPDAGAFRVAKRWPAKSVLMKNGCASRGWTRHSFR